MCAYELGYPYRAIVGAVTFKFKGTNHNSDVISVLRNELKSVADNSFNVLATRIDRFGVVAPNIQRLDRAERILVELPGIMNPNVYETCCKEVPIWSSGRHTT